VPTKQAYAVIDRAMAILQRTGRSIPTGDAAEPQPARDLLADVATVIDGASKQRSADVLYQLRARWETAYGGWSAQQFATALEDRGVEVKKRSIDGQPGQRVILTTDVSTALRAQRPESGHDGTASL
jgi:hypothetical protein